MGYTHYFEFKNPAKGKAKQVEQVYQRAVLDCQRIAKAWNAECKARGYTEDRLSGYTAHCKLGEYGGIQLNGKGENAHEEFTLREHFNQNTAEFCKTARKPYDTVVVACLAVLKHRLGDTINISSDGKAEDWIDGVALARRITKLAINNPLGVTKPKLRLVKAA